MTLVHASRTFLPTRATRLRTASRRLGPKPMLRSLSCIHAQITLGSSSSACCKHRTIPTANLWCSVCFLVPARMSRPRCAPLLTFLTSRDIVSTFHKIELEVLRTSLLSVVGTITIDVLETCHFSPVRPTSQAQLRYHVKLFIEM